MKRVENILPLIRSYIGTQRGDMTAFAQARGLSLSYVSLIMSGKRTPPLWLLNEMGVLVKARKHKEGKAIAEYFIEK